MLSVITILKTVSIVIGFSSAIINDLMTFKFLNDFKINKKENKTLKGLAMTSLLSVFIVSICLSVAVLLGVNLIEEHLIFFSGLILGVVAFNEIVFRKFVIFKLTEYRIKKNIINIEKITILRNLAFVLNTVSILSWMILLVIFYF